jgi:hypothetical protein
MTRQNPSWLLDGGVSIAVIALPSSPLAALRQAMVNPGALFRAHRQQFACADVVLLACCLQATEPRRRALGWRRPGQPVASIFHDDD